MHDQANKLRELVSTAVVTRQDADARVPMIVVSGAKAGVGATTVAVNLAAALADRGERVAVVDAAQHRNALGEAADTGRDFEFSIADVMAGKCGAAKAMVESPGGMRVLTSRGNGGHGGASFASRPVVSRVASKDAAICDSRGAQQRLLTELESVGGEIDLIVVDAGYGLTAWSRRFWTRAQLAVLVTTSDDASILAAYTAVKLASADGIRPQLRVVVNCTDSDHDADDAVRRIEKSCQRFLSLSVEALPALPRHEGESGAVRRGAMRVWESPHSAFGHAVLWMARDVAELLKAGHCGVCDGTSSSMHAMLS